VSSRRVRKRYASTTSDASEADGQISVLTDKLERYAQFSTVQALNLKCGLGQVLEERQLHVDSEPRQNEVIGLCHRNGRGNQRLALEAQNVSNSRVVWVSSVGLCIQGARAH